MGKKRHVDIARVVSNATTLNNPVAFECFFYGDCEDIGGFNDCADEISDVKAMLPEGIELLDLPETYCGNKKTKIYGRATCSASEGHGILRDNATNRIIFENEDAAKKMGYRPCKRCMYKAYIEWEAGDGH